MSERFKPDWLNAETCIENAKIAYDDSLCSEDGPVDTVIDSGDLGVLIGLAEVCRPLVDALEDIKGALLSDPPTGPQKSIVGDDTIYHLDGGKVYRALNAARAALSKARGEP